MSEKQVDPQAQLEFLHKQIEELREQTSFEGNRTQLGITERRYERALDAFKSITERYKGRLDEDDTIRDVMFALGFDTGDRCEECGRKDCPDFLERLLDDGEDEA